MTPEGPDPASNRWAEVKRLFDRVADLDAGARERCLRDASLDPAVVAEVRSLLAWDRADDSFLESPALPTSPGTADPRARVGETIGAWRIVDVIGRGGMGVVYHAERADGAFERRVALKVIGPGADAAGVVERFRLERETLARLDHRNVARLLDGGSTAEGQPYFVMEFVDGTPIDRYCDDRRMSIDDRLELFCRVAAGVQYAHQNLVVHRDIKPDNILVADDGTPKLLDFGVSRMLTRDAPPPQGAMPATWLLTPDFASPEQVSGQVTTTSADVYSLGVVLYVLLTGQRPYRLRGQTPAALQEQLATARIEAPSAAAVAPPDAATRAACRSTSPVRLQRRLSGDLDAIVARALGPTPESRYASVEQLVRDIRAHQAHDPVSARPATLGYRLSLLALKYQAGMAAAALVAIVGTAGVIGVAWQASVASAERARAERRFDDVRVLANRFLFDIADRIANVPGTMPAREQIVRTAVEYLESLAVESGGDPGLQRELAAAWLRVGDVQGNPSGANLGDSAGAMRSYRNAATLAEALRRVEPGDAEATRTLAIAHRRIGDLLAWSGEAGTALAEHEESSRLYAAVLALPGATLEDRIEAAIGEIKQGDVLGNPNLPNLGRRDEAATAFGRALEAFLTLDREGDDLRVRRFLGLTHERLGTLHESAGRWPEAAEAYRASFGFREALAAREPTHRNIQRDLAIAYEKLGKVELATGDPGAGLDNLRRALAQFERLAALDPDDVNAARSVAISEEVLAAALRGAGLLAEAQGRLDAALTAHEALAGRDAGNAQARCDAARVSEAAGDVAAERRPADLRTACARWLAALRWREMAGGDAACSAGASPDDGLARKARPCR